MRGGRPVGNSGMGSFGGRSSKAEVLSRAVVQSQALEFIQAGTHRGDDTTHSGLEGTEEPCSLGINS